MDDANKKRLAGLIRWGVTLAAVLWVVLKIDWQDQVRSVNGETLRGRVQVLDDRYIVTSSDSAVNEVLQSEVADDTSFQPGFLTLLKNIRPNYLVVGLVFYPLANVLGAVRWHALMRAHRIEIGFTRSLQLT